MEDIFEKLCIEDSESFLRDLLKNYLYQGLGSMSKRNIDALMLFLIVRYSKKYKKLLDSKSKKNRALLADLAFDLKAPISKVENLYMESLMKFHETKNPEEEFKIYLKNILQSDSFEYDPLTGKIQFVVEPYYKQVLERYIRKIGLVYDYSFNKDIIKTNIETFIKLTSEVFDKDEKSILSEVINRIKKSREFSLEDVENKELVQNTKGLLRAIKLWIKRHPNAADFVKEVMIQTIVSLIAGAA